MGDVVPITNNSGLLTTKMLLDNASSLSDSMDGVLLVWYEAGTQRSMVHYLTSNLTVQDANWFIDQVKRILHNTTS